MKKKKAFTLLLLMAFMAAGVQTAVAQNSDSRDYERGWYAGLSGGTSFGQATFHSITESKTLVGTLAGVFGGYQLTPTRCPTWWTSFRPRPACRRIPCGGCSSA